MLSMRIHLALLLAGLTSVQAEVQRLPEMTVEGAMQESAPVGPYNQPEWTTARRFPTTRVYVQQPPWGMAVEQWWRSRWYRDGTDKQQFQEEFEIGLPHRFQFDIYENWLKDRQGRVRHDNVALELRWALADWGKILLNPTLYGEWKFSSAGNPDVYELKLLLGEEITPRWHWGLNFIYEQEVGGGRATELAVSQAISYTLLDGKLSLGAEVKFVHETEIGSRGNPEIIVELGPSLQWRPTAHTHLDIVPLFGVTGHSPHVESFIVFGFDFGPGNERGRAPVSLKSQ